MDLPAGLAVAWFVAVTLACALCWTHPVRGWLARRRHPLLLAAAAAVLARLVPALMQMPADALVQWDVDSYRAVADTVAGGRDVYSLPGRYPYLPLHLYVLGGAGWISAHSPLPFLLLVKVPSIVADAGLAAIVGWAAAAQGRRYNAPALAMVFALNPVSLLVTGYHGQFDAIPLALLLGARVTLAARGRWWSVPLAGVLLGLAVADKTWPLLLAPLLLLRARGVRRQALFVAVAAAPPFACLGVYELLVPGGALHALRVASDYHGFVGTWGFSELLVRAAGPAAREQAVSEASHLGPRLLLATLGVSYLVAGRLRRDGDRMALILAATYGATAGWGVHWLSWIVPVALIGARRWCAVYLAAAGAYTATIYLGFGGVLWGFTWFTGSLAPVRWAENAGVVLWAGIALGVAGTWLWVGAREGAAAMRRALSGRRSVGSAPADGLAARAQP